MISGIIGPELILVPYRAITPTKPKNDYKTSK
ncbi:hypothetical protein HCH_01972 [Hahella chejuensis KCTC 2396]|uniref:Uncharacterized protein n=1 Tax=Hahella chejuensis (strain KCTC 2396) TaxID=349521 RepID=Q2SKL9_HAHCH|nr:hypothetical protein HCH_01972 [Hahella chejuensis KCTC 2396]